MQQLIGLAVDNCQEQHSLVNIRMGVYDKMRTVNGLMEQHRKSGQNIEQRDLDAI